MANITVKNIPDELYEKLKQQAAMTRRSINSEIIACLEQAVLPNRVSDEEILYQAQTLRKHISGGLTDREMDDAVGSGRP